MFQGGTGLGGVGGVPGSAVLMLSGGSAAGAQASFVLHRLLHSRFAYDESLPQGRIIRVLSSLPSMSKTTSFPVGSLCSRLSPNAETWQIVKC